MTTKTLKTRIEECAVLVGFEYKGKRYSIDPCFDPDTKKTEYYLYSDDDTKVLHSIDDVMKGKYFEGNSLSEISDKIKIVEF